MNTQLNRKDLLKVFNLVNLTMIEMGQHRRLLRKLDEITIENQKYILSLTTNAVAQARTSALVDDLFIRVWTLRNALTVFQHQVNKLNAYLTAVATQMVTPVMIAPDDLREVLYHVADRIESQPRLALPADPEKHIWDFYRILRIIPTVVDDHMVVALQVPLSDVSTRLNLYQVHNLPLLHPELKVQFTYQTESKYFAMDVNRTYYMYPSEQEVTLCQSTHGTWCRLTSALYSAKHAPTCLTSIYLKKNELIKELCQVRFETKATPSAILLKPRVWVVSVPETTTGHQVCLTGQRPLVVNPPYTILTLPPSCLAYLGDTLYLPPSATFSSQVDSALLERYPFLNPYLEYQPVEEYRVFSDWNLTVLQKEVAERKVQDLLTYDTLPIPAIKEKLHQVDYNYPKEPGFLKFLGRAAHVLTKGLVIALPIAAVVGGVIAFLYFCPVARMRLFAFCTSCLKFKKRDKYTMNKKVTYSKSAEEVGIEDDLADSPPPFSPSAPPKSPTVSLKATVPLPLPPAMPLLAIKAPPSPGQQVREHKMKALQSIATVLNLKETQAKEKPPVAPKPMYPPASHAPPPFEMVEYHPRSRRPIYKGPLKEEDETPV